MKLRPLVSLSCQGLFTTLKTTKKKLVTTSMRVLEKKFRNRQGFGMRRWQGSLSPHLLVVSTASSYALAAARLAG